MKVYNRFIVVRQLVLSPHFKAKGTSASKPTDILLFNRYKRNI